MINVPHVPVMSNEMCEHLLIKKDGIYLDGTVGFGGHSSKILSYGGYRGSCSFASNMNLGEYFKNLFPAIPDLIGIKSRSVITCS